MVELKDALEESKEVVEVKNLCQSLFNEWMLDLNFQEKEIWLWNSMVAMVKIKQRRNLM